MEISYSNLENVAKIVEQVAVRTPILESALLNEALGFRLLIKPESLQKTGSFKLRGAYHAISCLSEAQRRNGILAFSSGNHAQAVAYLGQQLGIAVTIVMPSNAPLIKRQNTEKYGAKLVLYDISTEDREVVAQKILAENPNAELIKPFDDPRVILGQGTAVFEALEDCVKIDALPKRLFVPCSGGGLLSGSALAASKYAIPVTVCEPEGYDSAATAIQAGKVTPAFTGFAPDQTTLCDALKSAVVGDYCYPIIAKLVDQAETVSDTEVLFAMGLLYEHVKLVSEPGGAASVAAVINQKDALAGQTVLCLVSGGNVDPNVFQQALNSQNQPE